MASPLVTVMMPVFNAASTLPWALASIVAQTYHDWELIIVDDGSTTPIEPLVSRFADHRIRLFRLQANMGRGYCRALALAAAHGDYLAMVDADDWVYSWKFERQVTILEESQDLVAVSCPVAVVDHANEITGIRGGHGSGLRFLKGSGGLQPLGISFPATMFRMDAAKRAGFRQELRAVEDRDFMIRLLAGQDYAIDCEILCAYRQELGITPNGGWGAYFSMLRATRKLLGFYKDTFPVAARTELLKMYSRFPHWLCRWFLARYFSLPLNRDVRPTLEQDAQFKIAYDIVARTLQKHFGACRPSESTGCWNTVRFEN